MRLAHFIQRYPPALGGSESYFARLSQHCMAQGDTVTVFTSTALCVEGFWAPGKVEAPSGVQREAGVEVRRYPLWQMRGRRWLLKPLSLVPHPLWECLTLPCNPIAWRMWQDAGSDAGPFDAVHASAFPYAWPIVCARRLARRLRVPFLVTPFLHLGDPSDPNDRTRRRYTSRGLRWLLQQADAVFVQTSSEYDAAVALGLPASKVILQGLGVDASACTAGDRVAGRRRWNIPLDGFVLGQLANHSHEKGTNDLILALEPLWRKQQPIHLLLAGPEMPNFTRFWHAFEERAPEFARHYVHRVPHLSDEEKRDFYAGLDVFVLPSRSDSFGLVLLEAWANGVPNLAYRAGGVADVIRQGEDGLLVRCGAIAELTEAIERMCADPILCQRLGAQGKLRVSNDFKWQDKLDLVREVYLRLIHSTTAI